MMLQTAHLNMQWLKILDIITDYVDLKTLSQLAQTCRGARNVCTTCIDIRLSRLPEQIVRGLFQKHFYAGTTFASFTMALLRIGMPQESIVLATVYQLRLMKKTSTDTVRASLDVTLFDQRVFCQTMMQLDVLDIDDTSLLDMVQSFYLKNPDMQQHDAFYIRVLILLFFRRFSLCLYFMCLLDKNALKVVMTRLEFLQAFLMPLVPITKDPREAVVSFIESGCAGHQSIVKNAFKIALNVFRACDSVPIVDGDILVLRLCSSSSVTAREVSQLCETLHVSPCAVALLALSKGESYKDCFFNIAVEIQTPEYLYFILKNWDVLQWAFPDTAVLVGFDLGHIQCAIEHQIPEAITQFCLLGLRTEFLPDLTRLVFRTGNWKVASAWCSSWTLFSEEYNDAFCLGVELWISNQGKRPPKKLVEKLIFVGFDPTCFCHRLLKAMLERKTVKSCSAIEFLLGCYPEVLTKNQKQELRHIFSEMDPFFRRRRCGKTLMSLFS